MSAETDDLKVGDLMVLRDSSWGDTSSVVPVVRLTPTRITVRDGERDRQFGRRGSWRREIGHAGSRFGATLSNADAATIVRVKEGQHRRALIRRIEQVGWKKLTTPQLEAIVASLPPIEAKP